MEETVMEREEPKTQTQSASASAEAEAQAEASRPTPPLPTTLVPSAPPPSLPGWTTLVTIKDSGDGPDLRDKVGPMPLDSERVLAVYVKPRDVRGKTPDIDK
eukprot:1384701-Karenia_brevis.AAC.1